ncbi:hypothetical protein P43SY_006242 [Pythium insidiosum]|uniref:Carbohydrate kinase FGGY N-terminal domain-containing protein n=1 Tax=Pythium insidiosum TaxID=114742 RepID=A0AAD5QA33_PYTIN|nr:hypothetical protein P43SY_006242 [Pythium insidiosum]
MDLVLGIDIGTTAVKCAVVDRHSRAVVASSDAETKASIAGAPGRAEQSVDAILQATQAAVAGIEPAALTRVTAVGLCGQMHGIVWWRCEQAARAAQELLVSGTSSGSSKPWSSLVTWEDQRCSDAFLADCKSRLRGQTSQQSSALATGYGLATFAFALESAADTLAGYDACGTIHDLVAFVLCGRLRAADATIDTTNAFSWGAFDLTTNDWDATAYVSTVDFVNIGTSAQLAMLLEPQEMPALDTTTQQSFEFRPYLSEGRVLGVAAALSGGNMVAWLVDRCVEWMQELGVAVAVDRSTLYHRLVTLGQERLDTELSLRPTLQGERGAPSKAGSIDGLRLHNGSLGDISAALCRGIIDNLVDMVPRELQPRLQRGCMIGTGNALLRNPLLQHFLRQQLQDGAQLSLQEGCDAAVGAALIAMHAEP